MATNKKAETPETPEETPEVATEEKKKRTRTAMPFGRQFGITLKFHNDMSGDRRDAIVGGLLKYVNDLADNETTDVHRSTRGEPVENLQTWLVAGFGYDWPEKDNKERGIRLPSGTLAAALKAFATKHNISMDVAAERFAEAFGITAETPENAEESEESADSEESEESEESAD